jgi:hypothetical protein
MQCHQQCPVKTLNSQSGYLESGDVKNTTGETTTSNKHKVDIEEDLGMPILPDTEIVGTEVDFTSVLKILNRHFSI